MPKWSFEGPNLREQRPAGDTSRRVRQLLIVLALCILAPLPAIAQNLTGTFYPVKAEYFLREPVWFVFQVTNHGRAPIYIDNANPSRICALMNYSFDVLGARATGRWRCGSYGGSCAGWGLTRLAPGATYKQKLLLNQWFWSGPHF
jgi:hypothetical protein